MAVNWTYFNAGWKHDREAKLRSALEEAPPEAKRTVVAALDFHGVMQAAGKAASSEITVTGFGVPPAV